MISDKRPKNSLGVTQPTLGLNSYASFDRKKSATTESDSGDDHHDFPSSREAIIYDSQEISAQNDQKVQELRLRLLKLADYKANMELKFKRQIILLNNEIAVMNAQNQMLAKVAQDVRKDVQDMKQDLDFIKTCMQNKQLRSTVSPDFIKNVKVGKQSDRYSPRGRNNKLFKPNLLKIK